MIIMQKVFNLFSTVAFLGVVTIGGVAGYVYVNKDAIVENVKGQAMEAVTEALPGLLGGGLGGGLPTPGGGPAGTGSSGVLAVPGSPLGF